MKKTLRTLALAAFALPFAASAQFTVETVWQNGVVDGVANPIPGLDAGWTKPVPGNPGTATASRFAVGKDGKIITTNHKENSLVAWDGNEFTTFAHLPEVTAEKWNGVCVTTDDAGNVVFNFCFTTTNSLVYWGVVGNDGNITEVELSTPLADLNVNGRVDILSHIVGDVTSTEGGVAYAAVQKTDHLVMFHFKGDGSKVTSVTAKASSVVDQLAGVYTEGKKQLEVYQAGTKYNTVTELLAGESENNFYLPVGIIGNTIADAVPSFTEGVLANFNNGVYAPLIVGNRGFGSVATFVLNGKKYIVRNYVAPNSPYAPKGEDEPGLFTNWKNIMAFGIFDEDGKCYATWEGSTFTNGNGSETITAEVVNENTVNIYVYAATGTADADSGTEAGCYAAMVKVSIPEKEPVTLEGEGTADNPYKIGTAEDLCAAYKCVNTTGCDVYFEQTADIDMAGVKEYHAIAGYDGNYAAVIHYDGKNHLIQNFAPENVEWATVAETDFYYCTSVFGVASGEISNLGVVEAKCVTDHGAGILAGYAGNSAATALILENVFVTGEVVGTGGYTGGMLGTTGNEVTMTDCFANVKVKGEKFPAGLIGRASNNINLERVYVAGTVKGPDAFLVMGTNKAPTYNGYQVIAFNTGAEAALAEAIDLEDEDVTVATPETEAELINEVKGWAGFSETATVLGLPALKWYENVAGISAITVDNENAPVEYYNLQGIRVNQPAAGSIVIKKQGSKTSKFVVR